MRFNKISLIPLSFLVAVNAFALKPITDEDIQKINRILTSPLSHEKMRTMLKEDQDIAKRSQINERVTTAFINNEIIKDRCENIEKNFQKSLSGIALANKTIDSDLINLGNSKVEGFTTSITQDFATESLNKNKKLLESINKVVSRKKFELNERIKGSKKFKIKQMKSLWEKSLRSALQNRQGFLQSEASLIKENCNKFILPIHQELYKRSKGTPFQKEIFDLWNGTYENCKVGHWITINLSIPETGRILDLLDTHYSDYSINSYKRNYNEIVEMSGNIASKVAENESKLKKVSDAAKEYSLKSFKEEVCTPLLKSAGLYSDSLRDAGYTEGLNVSQAIDLALEKLKVTCNQESIKKETFKNEYIQLAEALAAAEVFEKKLKNTAKFDSDECLRALEVYAVLRKTELRAYAALLEEEEQAKKEEEIKRLKEIEEASTPAIEESPTTSVSSPK